MTQTSKSLVSVKEADFLEQDPQLRGQNYVCLSFLSPEDTLKKKENFFFENFLKSFSSDMTEFFDRLAEKYKDDVDVLKMIKDRYSYVFDTDKIQEEYQYFLNMNNASLDKEFYEKNDFQTCIRGIKVRGVFETLREAEVRAQVLKRIDDRFHVYVAEVGCWCPWSPNPDDINEQEFAETHLNTLMKKYKENQAKKDYFFEERKRELQFIKTKEQVEKKDAWLEKKEQEASTSADVPVVPPTNESVPVPAPELPILPEVLVVPEVPEVPVVPVVPVVPEVPVVLDLQDKVPDV